MYVITVRVCSDTRTNSLMSTQVLDQALQQSAEHQAKTQQLESINQQLNDQVRYLFWLRCFSVAAGGRHRSLMLHPLRS